MGSSSESRMHVLGRLVTSPSRGLSVCRWLLVALGLTIGLKNLSEFLAPPASYPKDFIQEYVMARAAAHGVDPYLPPNELARRYAVHLAGMMFPHPSPHPPPVAVLFLPISALSYSTAAYLWLALGVASVTGASYLFLRGGGRRSPPWETLLVAVALLSWAPVREDLFLGNVNCQLLFTLALAWCFLRGPCRTWRGCARPCDSDQAGAVAGDSRANLSA